VLIRSRRPIVLASSLLGASLALAAAIEPTSARAAAARDDADVSAWRGRYCTPLGCRGATESALGNALGFAVAAGTASLLARRRRA
jgi:hypothetical protein